MRGGLHGTEKRKRQRICYGGYEHKKIIEPKFDKIEKPCPRCGKPVLTYKCREYCQECRKFVRELSNSFAV